MSFVLCAACATPSLKGRLLNAERRCNEGDSQLEEAEKQMAKLEAGEAVRHLDRAKAALADPDVDYFPEHSLLRQRLATDVARLPQVRADRAKRDIQDAVAQQFLKLEKGVPPLDQATQALARPDLQKGGLGEARGAAENLEGILKQGAALEAEDTAYAGTAKALTLRLTEFQVTLARAQKRLDFVAGPGALLKEGEGVLESVRTTKDDEAKAGLFSRAYKLLVRCSTEGKDAFAATPGLEKATTQWEGQVISLGTVVSRCRSKSQLAKHGFTATTKRLALARANAVKAARKLKRAAVKAHQLIQK